MSHPFQPSTKDIPHDPIPTNPMTTSVLDPPSLTAAQTALRILEIGIDFLWALACKPFEEPTLDLLWRIMESVLPVLRLIPGFKEIHNDMVLIGSTDEESCPRFHAYRRRIQSLDIYAMGLDADFVRLHTSAIIRLSHLPGGFMPSLRSLKIRADDSTSIAFEKSILLLPCLLQSIQLQSLSLMLYPTLDIDDQGLGPLTTILVNSNPNLRVLKLYGRLPFEYASALTGWRNLQSLALGLSADSWTFETIKALCTLTDLVELKLDMGETTSITNLGELPTSFPNLTKLILAGRLPLVNQFLEIPPVTNLQSISIRRMRTDLDEQGSRLAREAECTEWKVCCQKLARFTSLRELSLDWNILRSSGAPILYSVGALTIIEPLLTLRTLETLSLKSLQPFLPFFDNDIDRMATAWPNIRVLHLGHVLAPPNGRPTFAALETLAAKCPNLNRLTIIVGSPLDGDWKPVEGKLSFHGLQHLDLRETMLTPSTSSGLSSSVGPGFGGGAGMSGTSGGGGDNSSGTSYGGFSGGGGGGFSNGVIAAARHLDRLFPNLQTIGLRDAEQGRLLRMVVFEICQAVRRDQMARDSMVSSSIGGGGNREAPRRPASVLSGFLDSLEDLRPDRRRPTRPRRF
ncbi:hypothetical protein BDN72DRAFT_899368 [Pluteus cervinus]|uniref:Uncharacterized protein n=1 Tax=Pluteus cervinus TaxID=181527 RepID=A0ACD3AM15_9AGAR|nr:hypothetical protein BDN72DRAFT_899368 [Pluteus cervinus]